MNRIKKIKKLLAQCEGKQQRVSTVVAEDPAPVKPIPLEGYLNQQYEFRFNRLSEQTEYRKKGEMQEAFRILDKREINTLCLELMRNNQKASLSELQRYLQSSLIPEYHPFQLYLEQLPDWDGEDRLDALARRVSSLPLWVKGFHRWMLGLTAQWMGMDQVHANSVAPMLISTRQGMMKSTFCKSLLPQCLQRYYTDSIDLTAKGSIEEKLALMGLINMDEYDRLSPPRMAQLKNLMQATATTVRKAYQRNFSQLPRIASFIGTSNRKDLLVDVSGSRRFLCIEVEHPIDCTGWELDQIYAQLKAELSSGERYWFSKEDEQELEQHNAAFYQVQPEEELLRTRFRAPKEGETYEMYSLVEILDELRRSHAYLIRHCDSKQFSAMLIAAGLERVHTKYGNRYKVVRLL